MKNKKEFILDELIIIVASVASVAIVSMVAAIVATIAALAFQDKTKVIKNHTSFNGKMKHQMAEYVNYMYPEISDVRTNCRQNGWQAVCIATDISYNERITIKATCDKNGCWPLED